MWFHHNPGPFVETFRCFPISFSNRELENGDKIILPESAFEKLARMTISYPMQFELKNGDQVDLTTENGGVRHTHVGVLEFTAAEGIAYVPFWIMQNLFIPEGGLVVVRNVELPRAEYIKFQPQSVDFIDISNPKAVLENTLRNFSCVTKDDQICITYNNRNYYLNVVDVKPSDACSIVEADVKVDFDAPVGYDPNAHLTPKPDEVASTNSATPPLKDTAKETSSNANNTDNSKMLSELAKARELRKQELEKEKAAYIPFSGAGQRVDGKVKGNQVPAPAASTPPVPPSPPARESKWKTRKRGTVFQGEGRSLS